MRTPSWLPVVLCCVGAALGVASLATFDNVRQHFWAPDFAGQAKAEFESAGGKRPAGAGDGGALDESLRGAQGMIDDWNAVSSIEARLRFAWNARARVVGWALAVVGMAGMVAGSALLISERRRQPEALRSPA